MLEKALATKTHSQTQSHAKPDPVDSFAKLLGAIAPILKPSTQTTPQQQHYHHSRPHFASAPSSHASQRSDDIPPLTTVAQVLAYMTDTLETGHSFLKIVQEQKLDGEAIRDILHAGNEELIKKYGFESFRMLKFRRDLNKK